MGVSEMGHCIVTSQQFVLSEQQVTSCSTDGGSPGSSDWSFTGSCSNKCTKKKLSIGTSVSISGDDTLATALNTQPVSVSVEAGNSVWQNYQGDVVTQCPGAQSDHAVIAVGYDGQSYKVRNSCV
ncbi:Aste57867_17804 [Aphanomyces stellatus]|uniref:Aste57867_17804 protein n=1 Tax=Aphanomyces stellatus TaxID=120398 RepID=A0A485L9R9_9STRA|nr:hypothetical protein As57867_017743 [Aphanomyces stellatus]VFT94548.1 Aste57867_17804 [Aphanomyces stellatus]